jgi:HK97 family phage prohead protease
MTEPAFLGKELCGSVYANPPSDRVKPLTDDREISREELAVLCATLPAGPSKPVLVEHDPNKQVGVITAMFQAPQSGTTYARFKLYDTPEGRQTHQQIEAGRLRGLSLGTDWKRQPGLTTREVKLRELSVCTEGYRPDTGVFNASKDAQASGAVDFVSLPPVNQALPMDPSATSVPAPAPTPAPQVMQQPQQQPQQPQQVQMMQPPMYGSFNAAAQSQPPANYSYPPSQQPQQQQQQQYQLPFNMHQTAQTQPPSTTMPWGQFMQNPAQYFQQQQQPQQPKQPNELWHFMNMQQLPQPQMPYGFPQQQQQSMFYPPSQLAPPPYLQQQQQQQQQQQPPQQPQQPTAPTAAAPALPPGLKRGKRTASQVQVEDDESDEKNPGGTEKDSEMAAEVKTDEKKSVVPEKKQETETAAKLLPIPETEAQIEKVISAILATPGMSKDDKAANIRALTETHRQLKAMHEEKRHDVISRLDHVEKELAKRGFTNNPTFERLRREAADPAKFKTVIEEANSMLSMLEHTTGQSIAQPLNVSALAAPADGLQAALNEWRSLSAPPGIHGHQHQPQMGTVNASMKSQQHVPAFPIPRHDSNPHGITTVSGEPVVPLFSHERPLFDKPLPRIVDPVMGTVNLRG